MLAFIHIEKAAGQTFTRILENNFPCSHCRVAPLKKEHLGIFQRNDLRVLMKLNPFLNAISGHSIVPYSNLSKDIRYITILRDPVSRYISHYQYWVQVLKTQISFDDFLSIEELNDFQTKKIIGSTDIEGAIEIVQNTIFLTGIVEEFDTFLKILKNKISPNALDIRYKRRNVAKRNLVKTAILDNYHKYEDKILSNNLLDQQLYRYVKDETFKKEKIKWLTSNRNIKHAIDNKYVSGDLIGIIYRNIYIGPLLRLFRRLNGLKPGGSY